jgi:hypothetical protein
MRSKFLAILLFHFVLGFKTVSAQDDSDNEYSGETVFGLNLNTNAGLIGGIMFRHTKEIAPGRYFNIGAEWVNVKHPNEIRFSNNSGNIYVLGKKNYLFALRPQAGYEFVLFTKGKEDGIQVDAIINGGPTIGFIKPYYIQYNNGTSIQTVPYDQNLYDPTTSQGAGIVGSGGFFHGFDHMSIVPGVHLKAGLSFEFGAFGSGVTGIEVGAMFEAYTHRIDLLEISSSFPTYNRKNFSSLYVNIYFGGRR